MTRNSRPVNHFDFGEFVRPDAKNGGRETIHKALGHEFPVQHFAAVGLESAAAIVDRYAADESNKTVGDL